MCDPVTAGLLLTAGGGGVQAINNNRALRRQDAETAAGIRRRAALQRDANARVNEQIGEVAASDGAAERAASLDDFQAALRRARPRTEGSLADVEGANPRFAEDVGGARAALNRLGGDRAERLSVISGLLRQREGEAQGVGRTRSDLNRIAGDVSADEFLTRLRTANIRPDPFVGLIGSILQGAGSGVALKAPPLKTTAGISPETIIDTPPNLFTSVTRDV